MSSNHIKTIDEQLIRNNYKKLTEYLINNMITISTMESATSGQIASLITDTEGASAIFKGSFITYSNESKILCGVPADTINTFSVYSKEVAIAMANCAKEKFNTAIGVGITGTFGNIDPNNSAASVPGTVYIGLAVDSEALCYVIDIPPLKDRLSYKLYVADKLLEYLSGKLCIG